MKGIKPNQVVQIHPMTCAIEAFKGCLMVVTEVRAWGVIGYILRPAQLKAEPATKCYYRAEWDEVCPLVDNQPKFIQDPDVEDVPAPSQFTH